MVLVATLLFAVVACGDGDDDVGGDTTSPSTTGDGGTSTSEDTDSTDSTDSTVDTTASTDTTSSDGTTSSQTTETSAPTTTPAGPDQAAVLAVSGEGLVVIDADTGSTTMIPFGRDRPSVMATVTMVLGYSPTESAGNPECGNGQATVGVWPDVVSLDFDQDDAFISWVLRPDSMVTDLAGNGLGTTRQQLESTVVISVEETSLGTEFSTGDTTGDTNGLSGLLSGPEVDDVITDLWAGAVCAFR
jgi:hypothetical protein